MYLPDPRHFPRVDPKNDYIRQVMRVLTAREQAEREEAGGALAVLLDAALQHGDDAALQQALALSPSQEAYKYLWNELRDSIEAIPEDGTRAVVFALPILMVAAGTRGQVNVGGRLRDMNPLLAILAEHGQSESIGATMLLRTRARALKDLNRPAEALEILTKMQSWRMNEAERVFPGGRGGLLSDVAINKMLHSIAKDVTVHGFRSAFRQWGAEQTSFPGATLELALAHVNKDKVEAAYQRSDLFERRVELMAAWGRYCANASNIVQLATGKAA